MEPHHTSSTVTYWDARHWERDTILLSQSRVWRQRLWEPNDLCAPNQLLLLHHLAPKVCASGLCTGLRVGGIVRGTIPGGGGGDENCCVAEFGCNWKAF